MYRGRPPPRGGYQPPFEGRGPRPHPGPGGYRDDRTRPRPAYHPGYHDHGPPPDPYRRSPPRRRYPSPGSGGQRGGEFWAGGPPRERSPSPRGLPPIDHNLVITVGNELIGPSGSAPSRHHDRDYPPRPEYERSRSRPQSRSPDRSRAKSLGRSKSQLRSKSRGRSQSRSPDRSRAKSRGRSQSRSLDRSRGRSHSPDRSRAKSRGRSRSRSPDRSRAKSRGRSRSQSLDRIRAKSRGRSRSRSPDRSRAKSRGRSKSRPQSRSRSRGRSYSRAASRGRSKSHPRSRSSSSSSSSSSGSESEEKPPKEFRELQTARRRKELEEMLGQPTKSILKRRNDSEDSPSLRSCESPRGPDGSGLSRVAEQLLQAVKGMEPHAVAAMLSELRADPQMAHRAGLDAEIKEILHLLGAPPTAAERPAADIDDEEKFLYGDADEPKAAPAPEPVRLDLYGDVTEEALYADYPPQMYGPPPGAAPPLQAPPTTAQVDVRYVSPDQIPVGGGGGVPPGTEPLADGERQALEEYEKIQDLLKTIGLDLGVSEISKMAARTKERLHGNKPPPKTPTRRRRYSSGSSEGARRRKRRSHSSSSSSSSRSWSSEDGPTKTAALPKSHREANSEQSATVAPQPPREEPLVQPPDPTVLPPHAGVPIPTYPPSQVHPGMLPPSFPPPGYSQYGNYLPYMHQQWPPMYPPPSIALPPHSPEDFPPALPYKHPYNKTAAAEPSAKGLGKTLVPDGEKGKTSSGHDRRVSDEQNNESQKQKVLEEREKLKQERDVRMKKKEYLMKELERLRKQQGELLRRKRREKDGHKDPLLGEIGRLQEDVMGQISSLRREHEAAERSRNEIEKIALILGLLPTDRPRRAPRPPEDSEDPPRRAPRPPENPEDPPPPEKKKRELAPAARSPEGRTPPHCSTVKTAAASSSSSSSAGALSSARACPDKPAALAQAPPPEPFEYYDAGNHWCKNCNVTSGSMFDFFTHLHSKTHRKTLDPYERPWASSPSKAAKSLLSEEKLTKPAKGSEFLLPVRGFFCLLCSQFYGDAICAEEHVTTHGHNDKYKRQMYENPLYEQRRNLDRQAGLASETSGKKRKHEEDEKGSKDREDKPKHKKDKRDKKKDEDAGLREDKVKKDAEEEMPGKKEKDGFRKSQSLEEERPSYSRKDEEEKYRSLKKEEKPRSSREEEDRGKYRGRDDDDRYYARDEEYRPRCRRDDEDRPKYGPRDDDYKHGKYSDPRPRYDRDEGKVKAEKQPAGKPAAGKPEAGKLAVGKPEAGKPVAGKPEAPPKPYEQPRIFSGPSPAMRAKLRKQSQETGKPAATATPAAATPAFGKFTWKKKENVLAKEAEKVAAEFIKDDEEAAKQRLLLPEDSFAKSMAVAKEIAQKLGGQQSAAPPPWVSNGANRGRIRPNLPGPMAFMRKTAMLGKPAPLDTFLSMRPQNTGLLGPVPQEPPSISDGVAKVLTAQNTPPPIGPPGTSEGMPPPTASKPASFQAKPTQSGSGPAKPTQSGSGPAKPPPSGSGPPAGSGPPSLPANAPLSVSGPGPVVAKLPPPVCNPAPPVSKPTASSEPTRLPSFPRPAQQTMVKIVSDVAAPGVPESEQTRTVFVKPPPFMNRGDGAQKSDKLKTNLAAAKAQDLFDIFYLGQSGAASFTKPATDTKPEGTGTNKRPLPVPEAPKPEPQPPSRPQPQPVWKSPDPDSPSRQTQPDSDIQIESVWSEASTPTDLFQAGISPQNQPHTRKPGSQITLAQSVPQNQPPTPKPESQITLAQSVPQIQPPTPKPGSQITLAQSVPQNQPPTPKPESQITLAQSVPQNQPLTPKPESQITLAQSVPQNQPPTPKPGSQITLAQSVPQNQPPTAKPESQITLAHSVPQNQPPTSKPASQMNAPTQFEVQSVPQNQTLNPKSESQIGPETHSAEPELSFLNKTDPPPDQDPHPHQETHPDAAPEPEPKPSPKTRGKGGPGKRTPPATRPVRQTRSQTRYQTRQQHESPSEPETKPDVGLVLGDSDPDPEPRPLALDPGSGLEDPPMMEITPETLGLPPDMTALDFDYDFNFE